MRTVEGVATDHHPARATATANTRRFTVATRLGRVVFDEIPRYCRICVRISRGNAIVTEQVVLDNVIAAILRRGRLATLGSVDRQTVIADLEQALIDDRPSGVRAQLDVPLVG